MEEHYLKKYWKKWVFAIPYGQDRTYCGKLKSVHNSEAILNPSVGPIYSEDGKTYQNKILKKDINLNTNLVIQETTRKNIENFCKYTNLHQFNTKK